MGISEGKTSILVASWESPPNTNLGLSHHQEERQNQTAFLLKVLGSPLPLHC